MNTMTNHDVLVMTNEIIKVYAPQILSLLGLEENDGILDRINVSNEIPFTDTEIERGSLTVSVLAEGVMQRNKRYKTGSAFLTVYPLVNVYDVNHKGQVKKLPLLARILLKRKIKERILFNLAHELRHYWQHITGEMYKHDYLLGGRQFVPYEHRWCEKDANEFAQRIISLNK